MIEQIVREEIGLGDDSITAIRLRSAYEQGEITIEDVRERYGESVVAILEGLKRIDDLYKKTPVVESENFRNLLLSFAEDMRVVLIMIADRVAMMRQLKEKPSSMKEVEEAAYLYAPLAHKLGLYRLKSELEDLSLKFLEHDAYYHIKEKLNATKQARDQYVENFIEPIKKRLQEAGIKFHIKGRTKSIHSIWQKMKKQNCAFEGIYDLFAIRVIIDAPEDKEKMLCWQAYSIVTDMYQPNPKRLRDWLSVPKSNGYESLHITVIGPEQKWVEVQIRTERMDDIAERGVAAHWRYKGVKGASGLDEWLNNIRTILEANDDMQVMDQFKMDLYEDEVYVFTPKGDLIKFPKGATVLDFAYRIHSKVGNCCIGAKINNKAVPIREKLKSGDLIEIMTSATQKPKRDWLNVVFTSRAKSKIRLALKETQIKDGLFAKEMLERRFKNRKLELEESILARVIPKMGYKEVSDFYRDIIDGNVDVNTIIERYLEVKNRESNTLVETPVRSAGEYEFNEHSRTPSIGDDVLVIDQNLKGVDYQLSRCCQPIYGDSIFGFVTVSGGIRIHREDCPNAPELRKRFGYRIVKARWSGKGASQYSITLRVVGVDDLGIVNNMTSIISKDEKLVLRGISIDSHDGLFSGNLTVMLDDTSRLETLLRKLRNVKGVKSIERI
jgi:GTP pyrophosphokinase